MSRSPLEGSSKSVITCNITRSIQFEYLSVKAQNNGYQPVSAFGKNVYSVSIIHAESPTKSEGSQQEALIHTLTRAHRCTYVHKLHTHIHYTNVHTHMTTHMHEHTH